MEIRKDQPVEIKKEVIENISQRDVHFFSYRGSITHGTFEADPNGLDDIDLFFVYLEPESHYLGFRNSKEENYEKWIGRYDIVGYGLNKFFHLLCKNNPNVLSFLWMPKEFILSEKKTFALLRENRNAFLNRKLVHDTFFGYAYSQLKKMERGTFEGYMGEKRKALVKKFGYDCKNAAHLLRLLRMGTELLWTGELRVNRHDAAELKSIKRGDWSLDAVKKEAELGMEKIDLALEKSILPEKCNMGLIEEIKIAYLKESFGYVSHEEL